MYWVAGDKLLVFLCDCWTTAACVISCCCNVVRLGIIGEPLSLFDPVTLISLEPDEETEEWVLDTHTHTHMQTCTHTRTGRYVEGGRGREEWILDTLIQISVTGDWFDWFYQLIYDALWTSFTNVCVCACSLRAQCWQFFILCICSV